MGPGGTRARASPRLGGGVARCNLRALVPAGGGGGLGRRIQYIPAPMPPPGFAPLLFLLGICEMDASVVSSSDATDAAFCRAQRTTLVGSITPACTRFS